MTGCLTAGNLHRARKVRFRQGGVGPVSAHD